MKNVIITVPMKPPKEVEAVQYPMDGNKAIEYEKPIRCPINGVLAKTLKKDEQVKIIYILTTGENSECEQNKTGRILPMPPKLLFGHPLPLPSEIILNIQTLTGRFF